MLELTPLALKDKRLLLLVDGLDEWANETAARTALDCLEVTINTQKTITMMTGRPRGIEKLRGLGYPWKISRLAPLSESQQRQLVTTWFKYSSTFQITEASLKWQIDSFFYDLREKTDVQNIAGIPLLITGLLVLHIRQVASLPRNRFQVYKGLTELLLELHPKARSSAAQETRSRFSILDDMETRQRTLGYLAFEIREQGADNGILKTEAEKIIIRFLRDPNVLELSITQAKDGVKELLAVNAETSGILIEKSPNEIGFIHAVFEEYLTAKYLSDLPISEQKEILTRKGDDPRWHNIILNLLYLLNRQCDIDNLVKHIEQLSLNAAGRLQRNQLLAEIAFSDIRCTPVTANRIADIVFKTIDTGCLMWERQTLIKLALLPVKSETLQEKQITHLARWHPETQWSRENLFTSFSKWKPSDQLLEALWRGLFDSEFRNRRAAAIAIAEVYRETSKVERKLISALKEPYEPEIISTLIFALSNGWKNSACLIEVIDEARHSEDPRIVIYGIIAAIELGLHNNNDKNILLDLCIEYTQFNTYDYHNDLSNALLNGWPNDTVIFERCMESWSQKRSSIHEAIDKNIARRVLFKGYSEKEELIDHLCTILRNENDHFLLDRYDGWSLLVEFYKKHPKISLAIDDFISTLMKKSYISERDVAFAALLSGSSIALENLIFLLDDDKSFPHWVVMGILDGWGMNDDKAATALLKKVNTADITYLDKISYLLPRIIENKQECWNILIKIAQQKAISRPDFLASALGQLNLPESDELIDLLLPLTIDNKSWANPIISLIENFSKNPKIKILVKDLIGQYHALLATISHIYSDDEDICEKILNLASPLPASLRKVLIQCVDKEINNEIKLDKILSDYQNENHTEIRTISESMYYSRIFRENKVTSEVKEQLLKEISATGHNFETVSQAGFVGLLEANCLEIMLDAKGYYPAENPTALSIHVFQGNALNKNLYIIQKTIEKWDYVLQIFGEKSISRLGYEKNNNIPWQEIAPYITVSKHLEDQFINYCNSTDGKIEGKELQALARLRSKSQLLMENCLKVLKEVHNYPNYYIVTNRHLAGIILGHQYKEHKGLVNDLEVLAKNLNDGAIIALSLIEPEHEVLKYYHNKIYTKKIIDISYLAGAYIVCCCGDSELFFRAVKKRLEQGNIGQWSFPYESTQIFSERLSRDEECYFRLFNMLDSENLIINERSSIPRLLTLAKGVSTELNAWCEKELKRQESKFMHEQGYDIVSNHIRPVFHSLIDVLVTNKFNS